MKAKELNNVNTDKLIEFEDTLYYQIKLTYKYLNMLSKQVEEKFNLPLNIDEITALNIIKSNDGEFHQRDFAQKILKDRANTGRLLDALENQGYIKRFETVKNKRQARIINITEKGLEYLDKSIHKIRPIFEKLNENLNKEEIEKTKKLLINFREKVKENIEIHI